MDPRENMGVTSLGTNVARVRRLAALADHAIAPGEPDIRRFVVVSEDGHRMGRVSDVLIDPTTLAVAYVEVLLDPRFADVDAERRIVVPVDCARIEARRREVEVRGIRSHEVSHAPRHGAQPLGLDDERRVRRFYACDPDAIALIPERQARFWGVRRRGRAATPYVLPLGEVIAEASSN